jgi:hypothetical protein
MSSPPTSLKEGEKSQTDMKETYTRGKIEEPKFTKRCLYEVLLAVK